MNHLPKSVNITDDTMREGLQIESAAIPVEAKLACSTHWAKPARR